MRAIILALVEFFTNLKSRLVTQEFLPEGTFICTIMFTPVDIYCKNWKFFIRYRGRQWRDNRNQFSLKIHGMSWEDTHKPENRHLFVARPCSMETM